MFTDGWCLTMMVGTIICNLTLNAICHLILWRGDRYINTFPKVQFYPVCICVAPDLAINPGSGHHPVILVLQPFRPFSTVDGWQQSSSRIADVDFSVFATGGPDHRPAQWVILDMEGELPVVIVDLPYSGALIKVYWQQVPVVCLKRKTVTENQSEGVGARGNKIKVQCNFFLNFTAL